MTKVDDEMALEFLRLSELGHTYVDIGKRFDVNHRTVSEWVRRGREFSRTRHWQQIGRDQDARYMDEHHQLLLATAHGIRRAVETPPSFSSEGQEAAVLVTHHVLAGLQDREELLARRGIRAGAEDSGAPAGNDDSFLEGIAIKLREGLLEHLPEFRTALGEWASNWQVFRDRRETLVRETAGALGQRPKTADVAHELARRAVTIALAREFGDDGGVRVDGELADEELAWAVAQVEPRMDGVRQARGRISAAAVTCLGMVEDLVLRGGPAGSCVSCPEGARAGAR